MKRSTKNLIAGLLTIVLLGGVIVAIFNSLDIDSDSSGGFWKDWGDNTGETGSGTASGSESESETVTEPVSSCAHSWGESTIIQSTCATKGSETKYCTKCGEKNMIEYPLLKTHTYAEYEAVNATQHYRQCTVCKKYFDKENHAFLINTDHPSHQDPTCGSGGQSYQECSICGFGYLIATSATGMHTKAEDAVVNYVDKDRHAYACAVCETTITEQHTGTWATTIQPTCEFSGTKTMTCTVCNTEITGSISQLGHDYDYSNITVSSSSAHGIYCNRCQGYAYDMHSFRTATIAPTCTETGYTENRCTVCDYVEKSKYVSATGHQMSSITSVEATCTADGYTESSCTGCGETTRTTIPATGHDYLRMPILVGTSIARIQVTCKNCDYFATESVDTAQ